MIKHDEAALVLDHEICMDYAQVASPNTDSLSLNLIYEDPGLAQATVVIPPTIVDTLFYEAARLQKDHTQTHGFSKGQIPLEYILQNFKANLCAHVKEFLFKYCVMDFLLQEIHHKKLLVVGEPRLKNITIEPGLEGQFIFELSLFTGMPTQEWKYLPFKSPKRKNYKDLDRQVESFIEEEKEFLKASNIVTLNINDWVCFDIQLLDSNKKPLLGIHKPNVWLNLGDEEADSSFYEIFLGRTVGETFISNNRNIQEYFSHLIDTAYTFQITIQDML